METYTNPKELTKNPHFRTQRQKRLAGLSDSMLDAPIVDLVNAFNTLPYCFSLQSCYGHFVYKGQNDPSNLEPLPDSNPPARVEYRIAYLAFCLENNDFGKGLYEGLNGISEIDPKNIQFCSAEWFWQKQVNSYALQVEPERFKKRDTAYLDYQEAQRIESIRNEFFIQLQELVQNQQRRLAERMKSGNN